jgi:PPOX class probable F420-dependent enzyme
VTTPELSKNEKLRGQALKFLQRHKTAALGTVSPDGAPHVAIVTCVVDDDFNIYFATKRGSRKLNNILKDSRVAVTVGGDPKVPSTIQMEGKATVIDDPQHFIVSYLSREMDITDASWWPLLKTHGVEYLFLKIKVEWARWLNLDVTEYAGVYDEDFQDIITLDIDARK